ncbi:MAG: SpoIIE family protein phosphatase [Eubacterium sp.]|nr:SpoIIE family protein phosphatase [Eubacterium sp.]
MKKIKNFVLGGLQQKIFNLVLIAMILIVAAYTIVIVYQSKNLQNLVTDTSAKQQQAIEEISTQTMDAVVENSLGTSTELEAYIADSVFRELKGEVTMMADYAGKLLEDPEAYPAQEVLPPDAARDGEISLQLLTEEGVDITKPAVAEKTALLANMADMMATLYGNANINACFVGTQDGVLLITDEDSGSKFLENGDVMNFPVRERPWYVGAAASGELYFTDIEIDGFTGNIGIVCSQPIYVDGKLEAVVGADLFLDSMAEAVEQTGETEGSFVCIVNQNGHVIFSPESQDVFQVKPSGEAEDLRHSESPDLARFVTDAMQGITDVRLVTVDDTAYYMAGAPVETVGWSLISAAPQKLVRQPTVMMEQQYDGINAEALDSFEYSISRSKQTIIILILIVSALAAAAALILAKRIVKPLNTITKRIAGLNGRNLQFMMEDTYRTGDEIELLAESFADLSGKTVQYMGEIQRVTAEKERIGSELRMATAIQASQLPHLFPAFPDRKEFDIYASMTPAKEVGGDFYDFFLLDEDHIGLVMADVAGKGVPAALFMMVSRILIRNRIQSGESPAKALENVNDQLLESNEAELFVTVWLAVLEISTGKGVAANAGHEHPVLRRAGGRYELVKYRHSPAVAMLPEIAFKEHDFQLNPGDSIFVYTDGVAEATNAGQELFGTDRMLEALNQDPDVAPDKVLENVMKGIEEFTEGAEQFDDITMMCLQYNGPKRS